MQRVIRPLRNLLRGFLRSNDKIELSFMGVGLGVPLKANAGPRVIRDGLRVDDPSPLYEMDAETLLSWFPGYAQTPEFRSKVLYAETLAFAGEGFHAFQQPSLNIEKLRIQIQPTRYNVPLDLEPHRDAMLGYFKDSGRLRRLGTGDWENNRSARLSGVTPDADLLLMQEATYFDQIATNLSVDTDSGVLPNRAQSIRCDIEPLTETGTLTPLAGSGLANTLGVACVLYSGEGIPLLRRRNGKLGSINAPKLHCSASGVYELPQDCKRVGEYDFRILRQGMDLEIRQELNLSPDEYSLYPVALTRELPRHGKPQLFFAAFTGLSNRELAQRLQGANESYEFDTDPNDVFPQAEPGRETYDRFTYEGWAALWFARKFMEANEDLPAVRTAGPDYSRANGTSGT